MNRKKRLTLAGVVGILACGACGFPPLQPKTPLPPALVSVHTIAVKVEDGTNNNLFDSRTMSNATAENFNKFWHFPAHAIAFNAEESSDAVLKITVHSNTVSCKAESKGKQDGYCLYKMLVSVTLTAADGRILKSNPQALSRFVVSYHGNSPPEDLNANSLLQRVSDELAMTTGSLLYR